MNRRDYDRAFSEALLLLDLPVENGRKQRGVQIASDPGNVRQDGRTWKVDSQSSEGTYTVTPTGCDCPDGAAPRTDDIKWCKHRVAVSLWVLAYKLCAPLAAILVSEQPGRGGRWLSQHWQVADEGEDRMHRVFLKRRDGHISAVCDTGSLKCSQHKRMVCRHVRRAVERSAARRGKVLSWSHDPDSAARLARMGGELVTIVNEANTPIYAVASDSEPVDKLQETDIEKQRCERDSALPVEPSRKDMKWK